MPIGDVHGSQKRSRFGEIERQAEVRYFMQPNSKDDTTSSSHNNKENDIYLHISISFTVAFCTSIVDHGIDLL